MAPPSPVRRQRLHLRVTGAVQGVGFRPFVYRLACERGLTGYVRNDAAGAELEVEGTPATIARFRQQLLSELPPPASISHIDEKEIPARPDDAPAFRIMVSAGAGEKRAAILPDLALCDDCRRELLEPSNRRFRYPFITCTRCGPRFSIITGIPYDRPHTTMATFPLCPACRTEYEDPADRRFHAQPIACPACGPRLACWGPDGTEVAGGDAALKAAAECIADGGVAAIKGIGGFHLVCDARNESAVAALRQRKAREAKPLALMVRSIEQAYALCRLTADEAQLLQTPAAPIVLGRRRPDPTIHIAHSVAPDHPLLGLMLPYTPLHVLLLEQLGFPVVATSGNRSDEPMCYEDRDAVERLAGIADLFLVHDRPVARPVDDSVVRMAAGRPLILRRARGYAPAPLRAPAEAGPPLLATGAHLKSTIALLHGGQIVASAHLGDLDTPASRSAFDAALRDLPALVDARPARIVCDLHPDYTSTRAAVSSGLPLLRVQHHFAHIAAVLGEHEIDGEVLGVAWDGTGLGPDGTIWGGEFLITDGRGFRRFGHLRSFRLPGGDAAAREPRRSALSILRVLEADPRRANAWFTQSEINLLTQMLHTGVHAPETTSAGRLFDAAAALLGLCATSRYEGEAAMQMEWSCIDTPADRGYRFPWHQGVMDWVPAIRDLLDDLDASVGKPVIAARFHQGLAAGIVQAAEASGVKTVALAGGCFQNVRLLETTATLLGAAGFRPIWSRALPPGDGAIAFGQALVGCYSGSSGFSR